MKDNSKKTAAIVVTFNRRKMLMENIEKLLMQTARGSMDILVIDNASTDGTEEALGKMISEGDIIYYNTGANLGGAGGFQYGIRKAYGAGYGFFWLMDDDTFPEQDALEELLDADRVLCGNYGLLSSTVYWKDGSLCKMNIQRRTFREKQTDFISPYSSIVMATFVSFFVKRETVREYGLPIKEFFIWSDDLEYSRRISMHLPCYLVSSSKIIHCMSNNEKVGIEHEELKRLWRYKYLYRNEVYVFRREGFKGWVYLFERVILHIFRVIMKGTDNKMKKIRIISGSFFKGLRFHPAIEYVEEDQI